MKKYFLVNLIILLAIGCATAPTKPNISAIYKIPSLKSQLPPPPYKFQPSIQKPLPEELKVLFQHLYTIDPALALEVGKIPEFQVEGTQTQIQALARFIDLIENASSEEKSNLVELLLVGKFEFRKYSAPLQALLWISEREKVKTNYTSRELQFFKADGIDYSLKENPLKYSLMELLAQAWDFSEEYRWNNYGIVTNRLNAPELVNYYQRARFRYDRANKIFQIYGGNRAPNPKYLFEHNEATCRDFAAFAAYCLQKGGYEAKIHLVENPDPRPTARGKHKVCLFEDNKKKYIMDNGRPDNLRRRGIVLFEEYNPFNRRYETPLLK